MAIKKKESQVVKPSQKEKLIKRIEEMPVGEMKILMNQLEHPHTQRKTFEHHFSRRKTKFGVISDLHIGAESFDPDFLMLAFNFFKKEKVDTIYCVGDIVEGMSGRPGHIYELTHVGYNAQMQYAQELLAEAPTTIHGIIGNHDQWYIKKANAGVDVGVELENRLGSGKFHYLGINEADIILAPNVRMKLFHANDGTAYAVSYKMQKLMESFDGGEKPNILLSGHYHKALYMFNRNIHGYECGTFCKQSEFMRGKKIPAHKGFWTIEATFNKTGVEMVKNNFFPKY